MTEFRLKTTDKTRNYLIEEIKRNELISRKHKNVCITLNYIKHFLILASTVTRCISISPFASLVGISIGITSYAIGLKMCAITAEIKKYKAITKKIKKKHDNIVLFTKSKLDTIGVLICKALLDSVIIHDKFVSINNVLKEDNEIKLKIKNLKTLSYCLKCRKNRESKSPKV